MRRVAVFLTVVAMVVVACSRSSDAAGTVSSGEVDAAVGVTFDGSGCTVDSTDPITAGDRLFVLTSSDDVVPDVAVLLLREGISYDEFAAAQTPGGTIQGYVGEASVSFGPISDLEPNQKARRYIIEEGPYAIAAIQLTPSPAEWICGPLVAVG